MPIKDIGGPPPNDPERQRRGREMLARAIAMLKRNRRGGPKDDGADPVVPPQDPKPMPLLGGAEAELE